MAEDVAALQAQVQKERATSRENLKKVMANRELQDIVKALLERRRLRSVSRPDASSGRPSTSRAAIAGTLVTPTKPKHEPPRTRTSIGSPDQKGGQATRPIKKTGKIRARSKMDFPTI